MFGLRFDTLWQRHERAKRRRRLSVIAGVILFSLISFSVGAYMVEKPTPSPQSASDPPLKCPGLSLQACIFVFLSFCPPIIPTSVICLSSAPFPIAFPSHVSVPSGLISGKIFEYVGDFTDLYKVICGEARFPLY